MVAQVIEHPFTAGVIPTPYNPDPALLAIVEIVRDGLIRDQHVRLHNFGTFRLRWSGERQIKHPRTGSTITVAATPKITFTPAKRLRNMIDPERRKPVPVVNTHQSNLAETVQDVIDDNYGSSETAFMNSDFHAQAENNNKHSYSIKWTLGLLAAIPLVLTLLQLDFSADKKTPEEFQSVHSQAAVSANIKNATATSIIDHSINLGEETQLPPESPVKSFYLRPKIHTVETGENLWSLAKQYYGDALLWPHIYRANMRTLSDPDKIMIGKQLVIPGLQQSPDNLTNNDRALIAEGYYEVYQLHKSRQSIQAIYFLLSAGHFSIEWLSDRRPSIPGNDWEILSRQTGTAG